MSVVIAALYGMSFRRAPSHISKKVLELKPTFAHSHVDVVVTGAVFFAPKHPPPDGVFGAFYASEVLTMLDASSHPFATDCWCHQFTTRGTKLCCATSIVTTAIDAIWSAEMMKRSVTR